MEVVIKMLALMLSSVLMIEILNYLPVNAKIYTIVLINFSSIKLVKISGTNNN